MMLIEIRRDHYEALIRDHQKLTALEAQVTKLEEALGEAIEFIELGMYLSTKDQAAVDAWRAALQGETP